MENKRIVKKISELKIIPVLVLNNKEAAKPLADVLIQENLPCAEVTFRTEQTIDIISQLKKTAPSLLVGAGTVLTCEQAQRAVDAGAEFVVSPGFEKTLIEYCIKNNIFIIPGVATASEIQGALSLGLSVLKFFPAVELGGPKMIQALSAPFKTVRFVPTGGIKKENIMDFLALPSVLACGGSWLVKKDLVENLQFEAIAALVREAVSLVQTQAQLQ
ncbi:MAG: bifunctional 4-hydroxy-2-oxoglutarate aldolase/2-dehydro-3-deoxy-phosphogluconate aldolase [Spirochaetaceae bacterium]|nr:bifunctional 4-hydroxy-2-oxoglutarate aldolase/2-dehydro-3-deoxy-phosphogluconate aldolase [Spirochaetaceae bacterium]